MVQMAGSTFRKRRSWCNVNACKSYWLTMHRTIYC